MNDMEIFAATHCGMVRKINQDRYLACDLGNGTALVAVADGLGGHAGGEIAAQIAVESLGAFDPGAPEMDCRFTELLRTINRRILDTSSGSLQLNGMGTTFTAGVRTWKTHRPSGKGRCFD